MNCEEIKTEEQDKKILDTFKRFLGLEHFGWKFGAVMFAVSSFLLILSGVIMIISGAVLLRPSADNEMLSRYPFILMGVLYICLALVELIPLTVISFIMLKKNEYCQSTVYTDLSIARKRATSVGMIVFCFLFNNIAAIFYLINFIKTKNNAAAFDRIEAAQKGGNI